MADGVLASSTVGSGPRIAWFLHGILGSGRNWRTFVRQLAADAPDFTFVLPDLRNHGDTGPLPGPATLEQCAGDLRALPTPEVVVGHSFGGKVALQWSRAGGAARDVWVLDAVPVAVDGGEDDSDVANVLRVLRTVPTPAADRRDVRAALEGAGLSRMLVEWLLTSLKQDTGRGGWVWAWDLDGIGSMMASYFQADFGRWLGSHTGPPNVRIVRAGRSDRWSPDVLARIPPGVRIDVLPDAGHWVHVDDPVGLRALLAPSFGIAGAGP